MDGSETDVWWWSDVRRKTNYKPDFVHKVPIFFHKTPVENVKNR